MARPKKDNLDYFPFDVDFFEDKKIRALKGKYGSDGVMVYIYTICQIYKDGYYTDLDEDFILCMSDDLNITEDSTRQILKYLFSRSLLCEIKDSTLAKSVTIVTATSIQRRYQEAKRGAKRDVVVEAKYWVLEKSETLSFIKVHPNKNKSEINNDKSEKNINKSTIYNTKESKVKESKVNMSSDSKTTLKNLTQEQYSELVNMSSSVIVDKYIDKIIDWQKTNHKTVKNPFGLISKWIQEDRKKISKVHSNKKTSYDLDEWEKFAMSLGTDSGAGINNEV